MENSTGKRDIILEIAFDFFLNKGYEATTVRMICKKAKIEAPSLYYYFGSKKGLFFAVVENMLVSYHELGKENGYEETLSPEKMLEMIYQHSINYAVTHTKETKFYIRYTLFTPSELKEDIENYMKSTYERKRLLFMEYLTRLCETQKQKFDIEDAFIKFERLIDDSTFNVVFSNWRPNKQEISEVFNLFCKLLFKGICLANEIKEV